MIVPRPACRRVAAALALAALASLPMPSAAATGRGADGRFEQRTSSHFVLLQDVDIDETGGLRGSRRFEQDVLATLERAYTQVDAYLGLRPRRRIRVSVYDAADFDRRFAGLFRFPAAGFYGDSVHIRGGTRVDAALVRVLHHELVHAAFQAERPALVLPAWLNEGIAEWVEARAVGKRSLSAAEAGHLARLAHGGGLYPLAHLSAPSFAGFGPRAAQAAYLQSYAFVDSLARRHGDRRMREFIGKLLRTGNLERAAKRSFGADLATLERRFANEVAGWR